MRPLNKSLEQVIPWMSAYDQPEIPEGALDPLGLYSISDSLTVNHLCPGVRERQKHPGLLVPIAIGAKISEQFSSQYIDGAELSPMQVFEWYVVKSLVHTYKNSAPNRLNGLPGKDKVFNAINDFGSISASNYLKTPSVFGFYGVYKVLARQLDILYNDKMDEHCESLILAWEQDENISNINQYYKLAYDAVEYGLEHGKTQRNWPHSEKLAKHLNTNSPGVQVSSLLWQLLTDDSSYLRSEYISFIVKEGSDIWNNVEQEKREQELHKELIKTASDEMKFILKTIQLYEEFSRLLSDAFDHILFASSNVSRSVKINELVSLPSVVLATKRLPEIKDRLEDGLQKYGLGSKFDVFKNVFQSANNAEEWINALLEHHQLHQQSKPPNGKMPFFNSFDDGSIITRPGHRPKNKPENNNNYVHAYRLSSLWSFLVDLGKVTNE